MKHGKSPRLHHDKDTGKPVQTSEFAYSKVLDTVKEKEIQPDKPKK
jgi:hypothetical protein